MGKKRLFSKVLCKIFSNAPISISRGGFHMGSSIINEVLKDSSVNYYQYFPSIAKGKLKWKGRGSLVRFWLICSYFSALNPTLIGEMPQNKKEVSLVVVFNKVQREFLSKTAQMTLRHFTEKHLFLVWHIAPIYEVEISFSIKRANTFCLQCRPHLRSFWPT